MTLTPETLAELRRLYAATTPEPWSVVQEGFSNICILAVDDTAVCEMRGYGAVAAKRAVGSQARNAAFIAAAHRHLPALLDEVARLLGVCARISQRCEDGNDLSKEEILGEFSELLEEVQK